MLHCKTVIEVVNSGKYPTNKRKQFIKNLNRPDHKNKNPEDIDSDLQNMLDQGKQLVNYTEEQIY